MDLVISDASTLIHLAGVSRLNLLRDFYSAITIPWTVWQEVVIQGQDRFGMREVQQAKRDGWLNVKSSADKSLLKSLKEELDPGEAEAIAIAIELSADLILLDEMKAREIAFRYGLQKVGIIGILIRAKRNGQIDSLKEELDRLISETGFRVSRSLYNQSLQTVGEI